MAENSVLSDLCSACHMQIPKYKCPRCSTRTCSLKCSKLHKERAQCSGVRDPTAYIKRSQLTTPAGFDHDFNFLSRLEREIQDKESDDRLAKVVAPEVQSQRTRNYGRARHQDRSAHDRSEQFRKRAGQMGVTVHRAPKGMLRERENESRVPTSNKHLLWSLEWLTEDDKRCITTVPHTIPLEVAFRNAASILGLPVSELHHNKRKRESGSRSGQKQKAARKNEPSNDLGKTPSQEDISKQTASKEASENSEPGTIIPHEGLGVQEYSEETTSDSKVDHATSEPAEPNSVLEPFSVIPNAQESSGPATFSSHTMEIEEQILDVNDTSTTADDAFAKLADCSTIVTEPLVGQISDNLDALAVLATDSAREVELDISDNIDESKSLRAPDNVTKIGEVTSSPVEEVDPDIPGNNDTLEAPQDGLVPDDTKDILHDAIGNSVEKMAEMSEETKNIETHSDDKPISHEQPLYHFYLVKVKTGHPKRVLIPVHRSHTIGDILRGQAVLEFPSIQVLSQDPGSIPEKFMLEKDWKIDFAQQEAELRALAASETAMIEEANPNNIPISKHRMPNEADLMAILQQDIIG